MIKFTKPTNLNGAELLEQLKSVGVKIENSPMIDGDGNLWLDIKETDKAKSESVVLAHNGTVIAPDQTLDDKLARVGLSVADLKVALGL